MNLMTGASTWGADWLLSWAGGSAGGHILFLDLLMAAAGVYFHFQFLTDMAALAQRHQPEGGSLDRRLCRRRTAYLLVTTEADLLLALPAGRYEEVRGYVGTALALVGIAAALFIIIGLFELRGFFREGESAEDK